MPEISSETNSAGTSANSGFSDRIRPEEFRSVMWATAWFFFLLISYFILRPVRETMGATGGIKQLQGLMLATFVVMLIAIPAYSTLVARLPRRWVVRIVYHFFCVSLVTFILLMQSSSELVQVWSARVFFVWVNVFALFNTSVFWSVVADLFTNRQGKRLFGVIAAGGTAGAILGSLLTSQVATRLSTEMLLIIPVATIQAGLWCAWRLEKQAARLKSLRIDPDDQVSAGKPTGGGLWTGITRVVSSPYLALICVFLSFVQAGGTLMYFQQAEIVKAAIPDPAEKTQLFAYLDLGTQVLTLFVQLLLAGPILRRLGVSVALVILPIVYACSFAALALAPSLMILIVAMIACRSAGYGITVPAREVLFTVVEREDKYKSKSFIDTVVLRGGDALSAQVFGSLRTVLGVGLTTLNLWALPFAAAWAYTAILLGRRQQQLAADRSDDETAQP